MKRFLFGIMLGLLCAENAVASMSKLCEEVYGEEHYKDFNRYGRDVVLGEGYAIESAAEADDLQKKQILEMGRVNELIADDRDEKASADETVNAILQNTDDGNSVYQVVTVGTTGTSYEQYRIYLGDTEVSVLFVKGTLFMVARTSDAECYQDETTDEIEYTNEQFPIKKKQWIDFGPYENIESLQVALREIKKGVCVSLYVRKGQAPTFSSFDCRRKSKYDEDMSCSVTGEGPYYVAVYRYGASRGAAVERPVLSLSFAKEKEADAKPIVRSGMLARGKKHYLGPFHVEASFTAVLRRPENGVYTNIYVKKGSQAEYWSFDCIKKSSRTHSDLSCDFEEPGDYYIQVYRSKYSGGDEFELYGVDVFVDSIAGTSRRVSNL